MKLLKNISYSVISNLVVLLVSLISVTIVPKFIGVKEYGYWQLYLLYSLFSGVILFGWNDGIYLRYGGFNYSKIDKPLMQSQFFSIVFSQLILVVLLYYLLNLTTIDNNKKIIINLSLIGWFIVNIRSPLLYLLQTTNRIKEYAIINSLNKVIFLFSIPLIYYHNSFIILIFFDIVAKIATTIYTIYFCKDIVFYKPLNFKFNKKETIDNLTSGSKLMLANLSSMLILSIIRFGIEHSWGVVTFGKLSLILSISGMFMLFLNAISIVLFPILKTQTITQIKFRYLQLRAIIMIILFGVLIFYYPLVKLLSLWLPKYNDSLRFLVILMPVIVLDGKMSFLLNTYMKTLRLEKFMFHINLFILSLSIISTYVFSVLYIDLNMLVFSIIVLLTLKNLLSEYIINKHINISAPLNTIFELLLISIFIILNLFFNIIYSTIIYFLLYILYIFYNKKYIISLYKYLIMRNR